MQRHPFILSLPKEWKSLETVDLSSNKEGSENSAAGRIINSEQARKLPKVLQNLNQRVTVFDYNNELFYETPAFQDFLDEGGKCATREALQAKVKMLAEMRGFKVIQPQGEVLNQKRELKNVFQ